MTLSEARAEDIKVNPGRRALRGQPIASRRLSNNFGRRHAQLLKVLDIAMRDVDDIRAALVADWAGTVDRTSMWVTSGDAAWAQAAVTRRVLALVDGQSPGPLWDQMRHHDFGSVSAVVIEQWFINPDRPGRACAAEVVAWESQVLAAFGWVDVQRLEPADWRALRLDEPARFQDGSWTRGRILADLPAPSLTVDNRIYCYAPADAVAPWAFFDVVRDAGPPWGSPEAPLRSVRPPGAGQMADRLLLTPAGRAVAVGWLKEH